MLDLGRHGGYILASYAVAVIIMGGIVWQTITRYRTAKRAMSETDAPGVSETDAPGDG
jgi:heme exporter protein CcmD